MKLSEDPFNENQVVDCKELPFSKKCNHYLSETMIDLKRKLATQARILKKLEHNQIGMKHCVTLTTSEEELFCRSNETNSTIFSALIRELKSQYHDLNTILNSWIEFANIIEEFASTELDIETKLSDLNSIVCCLARKTKDFEESEVAEENCVHRERKQFLQRSEERRIILKDLANSFLESEDRDHLIRENRRMREKTLDKERLMDRAALKLALKRMMRIMGAPEITEIQKMSSLTKNGKSASRISMTKSTDLSEFTLRSHNVSTFENCEKTEFRKETIDDSNLEIEKLQSSNGCECNARFSSHVSHDSISVQVEDSRDISLKKFSWWRWNKNKIRKNKMVLFGRKTAGDICGSAISK